MLQNSRLKDSLVILIVTILGLLLLVVNPGYYNHDELQRLDYIERHGFFNYISSYVVLSQGNHFGVPVRPIPFFIQGMLAFAMKDFPVAVHLFDVLTHGAVAVLIYFTLLRFICSRNIALGSACVFALNPMAVIAVGWSAALMDRWFVLFGIGAFMFADSYVRRRSDITKLGLVFIFVLASILSKETAISLPAVILIFVLTDSSALRERRFWLTCAVFIIPVISYLLYRLPSIQSSFGNGGGPYAASLGNILEGLLVYLAYPFLYGLTEAGNWVFVSKNILLAAAAVHFAIIATLWRIRGWRLALGYLFFYFSFLLPVLFIPSKGAHYLYASSIFFSILIAWLIAASTTKFSLARLIGILALIVVLFHTVVLQLFIYRLGACMDKAMITLESAHLSLGRPRELEMRGEPGAPSYILGRFSTGRDQIGDNYPIRMTVADWDAPKLRGMPILAMDRQCRIYILP